MSLNLIITTVAVRATATVVGVMLVLGATSPASSAIAGVHAVTRASQLVNTPPVQTKSPDNPLTFVDPLLQKARAEIREKDYKSAATNLEHYVTIHRKSDDALYLLSFVYFRLYRPKDSLNAATQAAAIKPPKADDLKIVSLDYSLLGDYESAAKYLEIAKTMEPHNIEVLYYLGRVRYQQNHFSDAIAAFRAVLSIDPAHVKATDNLGLALEGAGDLKGAEDAYRHAIQITDSGNNSYERPWLNLGRILEGKGDLQGALSNLQKAAEINPRSAEVLLELGKAKLAANDLPSARQYLEQSVAIDDSNVATHYALARVYKRLGESDLAAKEFARTQKLTQK
jgi:tetratricopeptide (TPR) repeat protein